MPAYIACPTFQKDGHGKRGDSHYLLNGPFFYLCHTEAPSHTYISTIYIICFPTLLLICIFWGPTLYMLYNCHVIIYFNLKGNAPPSFFVKIVLLLVIQVTPYNILEWTGRYHEKFWEIFIGTTINLLMNIRRNGISEFWVFSTRNQASILDFSCCYLWPQISIIHKQIAYQLLTLFQCFLFVCFSEILRECFTKHFIIIIDIWKATNFGTILPWYIQLLSRKNISSNIF